MGVPCPCMVVVVVVVNESVYYIVLISVAN